MGEGLHGSPRPHLRTLTHARPPAHLADSLLQALAFRKAQPSATTSTQLYSASFDRTLKLFDLRSMGYVETLFGHQAPVLALDALRGETAVSTGGRDKSVRFWKIPEETQLVFRGGGGSKWMDDLDGMEVDGEEFEDEEASEEEDGPEEDLVRDSLRRLWRPR